jgi:membrane protein DedA with SNARE-associated domain
MLATAQGWLVLAAATTATSGSSWWEYVLLFLCVAASWAGVPGIGSAAVGAAAVGASQGSLDLTAVIIVSTVAGEAGGLLGYAIGTRWGTRLLQRPGKRQAGRQKLLEKGERAYATWGRLAVFFTPAIISGTARMKLTQFAVWNAIASFLFSLSVALTAYGVGRVATGNHTSKDVAILVIGLVVAAVLITVFLRRRRANAKPAPA